MVDVTATPWYGSGSPKPEGTLFEWIVTDFSVYDAFESGLAKVVRLPEEKDKQHIYLDLWDHVKGARTKEEYLTACKGAVASIYSSWRTEYEDWASQFETMRGPAPALLVVASDAKRAAWLYEHLTQDYELLRNENGDKPQDRVTVQVDTKVFDAERGNEAVLRHMVSTVGQRGQPGENVRAIVSVSMLTEGWDVKSVTHILGLRAFGSPLLTEQIIGRGLRRTNYDVLNQPLDERPEGYEETVDAFGIPFVGFPVQRRKRSKTGQWGQKPVWIYPDKAKEKYRLCVPNVRSWGVGVTKPITEVVDVEKLPETEVNPRETPPEITVRPVVGGQPKAVMTLEQFRREYPLLKTVFLATRELWERVNPGDSSDTGYGPTFDELLDLVQRYFGTRVTAVSPSDLRDAGIYKWRQSILDVLETAARDEASGSVEQLPILGEPPLLDTGVLRRFQWSGVRAKGRRCHTSGVPCHTDLEADFSKFLDRAKDVVRYMKNERFGFSITYYENNRPRQYFADFIVVVDDGSGSQVHWLAETKGEVRPNTRLKSEAAQLWCSKMSQTRYGEWRYLFAQQRDFYRVKGQGARTFAQLADGLAGKPVGLTLGQ